jgi:hypothetical protein
MIYLIALAATKTIAAIYLIWLYNQIGFDKEV